MTLSYFGAACGCVMILVVAAKVFVDRQMAMLEGIPIALMFGLCSFFMFHGRTGFIFFVFGMLLLVRFYARVAPDYKRRIADRIEANRLRNQRNG